MTLLTPRATWTLALASAALISASPSAAAAQTETKTLAGPSVSIYDLVGTVTVERGSGANVVVEVTRRGADSRRLSIEVGDVDGRNSLRVVFPDDDIVYPELGRWSNSEFSMGRDGRWDGGRDSWWGGRNRVRVKGSGRGTEAWADLKVMVPDGKKVDINVGVGRVNAAGVNGDLSVDVASAHTIVSDHNGSLRLNTGSGGAEVRGVKGEELSVNSGSGRVSVDGATMNIVRLETGSGGVSGDRISAGEIRVEVGSGGVRIERATSDRVRLETGSGGVNFELSNSPKTLDVHSGSGSVTVILPSNLDAELDIDTGSGGIDSDFPVTVNRYERHHVRGTVGKGTGRIRVETGSGGVRLRKA
jgi:DUF4097 and DUF4098 domain-containing protein YvlB